MNKNLAADLSASLVVFLVAVPLSLGIALASGANPAAGLIAAAVGGIVVGALSGSPLQVSGPAAGMTVLVFGAVQEFGFALTCLVTLIAGLTQMLLSILCAARFATRVPPAAVHGMLSGIGLLIILSQLHVLLGSKPSGSGILNLKRLPESIGGFTSKMVPELVAGLLSFVVLLSWQWIPGEWKKKVPASLVAVTFASLMIAILGLPASRVDLPDQLFTSNFISAWSWGAFWKVLPTALVIAVVASIESLLSAIAVDKLHTGERSDLDRELLAQGVGNAASGALGGLPVTGVIVRSAANVGAGAKSRNSAILHGVWVLSFTLFGAALIERVPLAALAGLLIWVGWGLCSPRHFKEANAHGILVPFLATFFGVVCVNLLAGVVIGIAVHVAIVFLKKKKAAGPGGPTAHG